MNRIVGGGKGREDATEKPDARPKMPSSTLLFGFSTFLGAALVFGFEESERNE
jgi:hypothetical protein